MARWKPGSCPRCGGDMFIDRSLDGWYEQCLQCSFKRDLKPLPDTVKQETVKPKKRRKRRKKSMA